MRGAESTIEVSRVVRAPVDRVWRVFTDLVSRPAVMSTVDSVEILTGGPFGTGTAWRETRTLRDDPVTEEWRVVAASAPYRCVISSHGPGEDYQVTYEFRPHDGGTRIDVRFQASALHPRFSERILTLFFGGMATRIIEGTLRRDLDDLASAVERAAA